MISVEKKNVFLRDVVPTWDWLLFEERLALPKPIGGQYEGRMFLKSRCRCGHFDLIPSLFLHGLGLAGKGCTVPRCPTA